MRKVTEIINPSPASDGAGVKLLRVFGGPGVERFDPFLMLDEFGSYNAEDYIAGFPSHPHRGFETITYMLEGKMEHRDHMNNVGLLSDGDVQWMTAAKGVIHSEMPKQTEGRMRGFQLWLNLARDKKLDPARYQDIPAKEIPFLEFDFGSVKAIAGQGEISAREIKGYMERPDTAPVLWDIRLNSKTPVYLNIDNAFNAFVYVFDGEVIVSGQKINAQKLARLTGEGEIEIQADNAASLLVIAGRPLKEPIVQYGPFVMNSAEEIEQAIRDFQRGVFVS